MPPDWNLIAILADHYKLYVEPNRRWYEQAARAVLPRHQGKRQRRGSNAFLRAKPGQSSRSSPRTSLPGMPGQPSFEQLPGSGSYSPDFDIAPGMEILDGLARMNSQFAKPRFLESPTCSVRPVGCQTKAEAHLPNRNGSDSETGRVNVGE